MKYIWQVKTGAKPVQEVEPMDPETLAAAVRDARKALPVLAAWLQQQPITRERKALEDGLAKAGAVVTQVEADVVNRG